MMAATLVSCSSANVFSHLVVDPLLLFFLSLFKGGPEFLNELAVFYGLVEFPFFTLSSGFRFAYRFGR